MIFYALHLTMFVAKCEQWFHSFDLFSGESDVAPPVVLPIKANWPQPIDDAQTVLERRYIPFVTQTRGRTIGDGLGRKLVTKSKIAAVRNKTHGNAASTNCKVAVAHSQRRKVVAAVV